MAKKVHGPLIDLRNDLNDLLLKVNTIGNEALNEAADMIESRLVQNTPVDTGRTRQDWINEKKYNLVKYIWNENLSKSGIPVVNLLEFGSNGKPFAIKTFRDAMSEVESKIEDKLKKFPY